MQMQCIEMIREGVNWDDVHLLAHEIAVDGLLDLGILQGNREDIMRNQISLAFFPHGLGHYLGLDTHDKGGNPNLNDKNKLYRYLRTRGPLPAGSVVTVEPGVSGKLTALLIIHANFADLLLSICHRPISRRLQSREIHQQRSHGTICRCWRNSVSPSPGIQARRCLLTL